MDEMTERKEALLRILVERLRGMSNRFSIMSETADDLTSAKREAQSTAYARAARMILEILDGED